MDNEKRQALSVYRMEQLEETLKAAKMCLEYHLYKDCINRSYYVAFYAVKAVLAIEGIDFKRHKDAVAYFNKTYVASGKVSREVGKRLGRIKTVREDSCSSIEKDSFSSCFNSLSTNVIYNRAEEIVIYELVLQ